VLIRSVVREAFHCKAVRSSARLIRDRTRHQPGGANTTVAPLFISACPPYLGGSWTFSRSATMSTAKCRGAVAPALQAAPPLLASVDSQILRRQWMSLPQWFGISSRRILRRSILGHDLRRSHRRRERRRVAEAGCREALGNVARTRTPCVRNHFNETERGAMPRISVAY
jgi:hypothetical protein